MGAPYIYDISRLRVKHQTLLFVSNDSQFDMFGMTMFIVKGQYFISSRVEICDQQLINIDVHGSVYHKIKLIEKTNKMQPCNRIYYSNVS